MGRSLAGWRVESRLVSHYAWGLSAFNDHLDHLSWWFISVDHRCPGEGRRQSAPLPPAQHLRGPPLTPAPRLASWELTWYIRTHGDGSPFHRIQGPGNCIQGAIAEKRVQHPCFRKNPPAVAMATSGELRKEARQRRIQGTPPLFQPCVLAG